MFQQATTTRLLSHCPVFAGWQKTDWRNYYSGVKKSMGTFTLPVLGTVPNSKEIAAGYWHCNTQHSGMIMFKFPHCLRIKTSLYLFVVWASFVKDMVKIDAWHLIIEAFLNASMACTLGQLFGCMWKQNCFSKCRAQAIFNQIWPYHFVTIKQPQLLNNNSRSALSCRLEKQGSVRDIIEFVLARFLPAGNVKGALQTLINQYILFFCKTWFTHIKVLLLNRFS